MENIMQELRQKFFVEPKCALSYPKTNREPSEAGRGLKGAVIRCVKGDHREPRSIRTMSDAPTKPDKPVIPRAGDPTDDADISEE